MLFSIFIYSLSFDSYFKNEFLLFILSYIFYENKLKYPSQPRNLPNHKLIKESYQNNIFIQEKKQ